MQEKSAEEGIQSIPMTSQEESQPQEKTLEPTDEELQDPEFFRRLVDAQTEKGQKEAEEKREAEEEKKLQHKKMLVRRKSREYYLKFQKTISKSPYSVLKVNPYTMDSKIQCSRCDTEALDLMHLESDDLFCASYGSSERPMCSKRCRYFADEESDDDILEEEHPKWLPKRGTY